MEIREYLISVTAAAIISSCIGTFFDGKSATARFIKVLCGLFVSLAVIRPLADVQPGELLPSMGVFSETAQNIAATASEEALQEQRTVIKQQTETYVCDKAYALGCQVSVSVDLSDASPYAPCYIQISGNVSPYAKAQLSAMITSDLGIEPEAQQWNS